MMTQFIKDRYRKSSILDVRVVQGPWYHFPYTKTQDQYIFYPYTNEVSQYVRNDLLVKTVSPSNQSIDLHHKSIYWFPHDGSPTGSHFRTYFSMEIIKTPQRHSNIRKPLYSDQPQGQFKFRIEHDKDTKKLQTKA